MSDFSGIGPLTEEQYRISERLGRAMDSAGMAERLGPAMGSIGDTIAEQAHGPFETARYQFDAAGKALADGIAHIGTTALRLGFNTGRVLKSGITSIYSPNGEVKTWADAESDFEAAMRAVTGSTDPGALDWLMGPFSDTREMSVGDRADREIRARLGQSAVIGESIGAIASFAVGPGGMLGRETASLIMPTAKAVERAVAKRIARGAVEGADPAVVGSMLRSGQPLRALAQLPEWQQQASRATKVLAWGGRKIPDLLSTSGSLVAQSYAMSPKDEQGTAVMSALLTAPLIVPIARAGQHLASRAAQAGLTDAQKKMAGAVYQKMSEGLISPQMADDMIRAALPARSRSIVGNAIAAGFEGSAFTWMQADSWKDMQSWLGGDSEAGARLRDRWLASVVGIAVAKYAVPHDLAPMFQQVRPDLNSLRTYAEAEAMKMRGLDQYEKVEVSPRQEDPWVFHVEQSVQAYDWAEGPTRGLLGGGFRPVFAPQDHKPPKGATYRFEPPKFGEGEKVALVFGSSEPVVIENTARGIEVFYNPETRALLEDFRPGVTLPAKPKGYPAGMNGPTGVPEMPASGETAGRVLDALSMLGSYRRMQGDLQFARMGFREVSPGIWADDANAEYWTMELDGTSTRRSLDGKKVHRETLIASGGYDEPSFRSDALDTLQNMLVNHTAIAPDSLVDGIIGQAVLMAQHGDSVGARGLRAMFAEMTPEEVAANLTPDRQDFFAMQLGMVGSGLSNGGEALSSLGKSSTASPKPAQGAIPGEAPAAEPPPDRPAAPAPALGAEPSEPAPRATLGEQIAAATPHASEQMAMLKERGRLEQLATLAEEKGDPETAGRLRSILDTGTPEQVRRAIEEHGTEFRGSGALFGPTEAHVKRIREAAASAGIPVWDWAVTDRIEAIRRTSKDPTVLKWLDEMDRSRSEQRTIYGEAQSEIRSAEKALRKMGRSAVAVVDVNGTPMYRWQALMEQRIEPANDAERVVQEGLAKTALHLWNSAAREGFRRAEMTADGEIEWRQLQIRDRAVMPRMPGADWEKLYRSPEDRKALFQWLIDHNKITTRDPETGQRRPMTVDEMNKRWLGDQVGAKVDRAEREAAFEFVRELQNFPSVFRGMHLLEQNPFEAMRRLMREQSGRIAVGRVWGQDIPERARKALERDGVALKPGATASLEAMQTALLDSEGGTRSQAKIAQDVLVTLQGGTPQKLHPFFRAIAPIEGLARSSMTILSGIHDIPAPLVQGPAYAGWKRAWRALTATARSPIEVITNAERAGSLMREMGSHDFREAEGKLQTVADLLSWFATKSERVKTAVFDRMAVEMLADWARGRVTNNDRDVLTGMLRLPPELREQLLSGEADQAAQNRFRHEFVKMTTGRRTVAEGSEFLASPNLQKTIRFGNWITGRLVELARNSSMMVHGTGTPWSRTRAMVRSTGLTAGWGISGMATMLAYYVIQDLFKGENGFERWKREVAYMPTQMLWRGLQGQLMGGPLSMATRAMSSNEARDWAQLTSITSFGFALAEAAGKANAALPLGMSRAAMEGMQSFAVNAGLEPRVIRDLAATASAAIAGADPSYRSDARAVLTWERAEELPRDQFARTKSPQFYDALGKIHKALQSAQGSPKDRVQQVLKDAEAEIRAALQLAPEESVAASVRSFQLLDGRTPEQRAKLADFMADDDRMQRIYAHDQAVRELAAALGRMHGEAPTPIAQEIELVESQARLGDNSQWRKLVDRGVDDALFRLQSGEHMGSDLRDIAEALAAFPTHLDQVLAPRQVRALTRPTVTYAYRARMLATILERRARERSREAKKQ